MNLFMGCSITNKTIVTEIRTVEKDSRGDGNVLYIDGDGGYTVVFIYGNSNFTLKICAFCST